MFAHAVSSNLDCAVQNPSEPDVCDYGTFCPRLPGCTSQKTPAEVAVHHERLRGTSASGLIHASNVNSVNAATVADSPPKVTCVSTPLKYMDAGPT